MKISFVQVNYNTGNKQDSYFLPYSVACIWSYLNSFPDNPYTLNQILFKREPIDQAAKRLQFDSVVGFSCYIWNRNYNLSLAKKLKELNPNIKIVFGGPELEISDPFFFKNYPYIDIHVVNEGETVFKDLMYSLHDLSAVNGIIYNDAGRTVKTPPAQRILDLSILPSPYIDGTLTKLAQDNPDIEWNCTIETNRGCPYMCSFCDWGSLTYSKVKKFNLERVFAEFDWAFTHNCYSVELADANFGIFVDRDNTIIDEFIRLIHKYDKQVIFYTNWAKNQNKAVINLVKKLITDGNQKNAAVNISLQSLNENVLDAINRKNLHTNRVLEVYNECQKHNIPLYTEFIMGLPKETLDSFKDNFYKLFTISSNIHVNIYKLAGLSNSELFLTNQDNVQWRKIHDWLENTTDDIDEETKWVYSTDSMSYDDIYLAAEFSCYINTFHLRGITNILSDYYDKADIMGYKDFYTKLYDFLRKDEYFASYFSYFKDQHDTWYSTGKSHFHEISSMSFHANNYLFHLFLKLHNENKIEDTLLLLKKFLLSEGIFENNIFTLQSDSIITFEKQSQYPMISGDTVLINNNQTSNTFDEFVNRLYFFRERSFGKAMIKINEEKQAA